MKRILRILLIAAIVFSLVASSVFLILNSHHKCHAGESCPICVGIENAFGLLKCAFSAALVLSLILLVGAAGKAASSVPDRGILPNLTPTSLKVRLNN